MVAVSDQPIGLGKEEREAWLQQQLQAYPLAQQTLIQQALQWVQSQADARECWEQAIEQVAILAHLSAGVDALLAAALLPYAKAQPAASKGIEEAFGKEIHGIVHGAIQMDAAAFIERSLRQGEATTQSQVEAIRQMFLAMINDVRVVLAKLAERLYSLRHVTFLASEAQRQLALEVKHVYAPLANRLGIGQLKWELEDRVFKILAPKAYQHLKQQLHEKRLTREQYLQDFEKVLREKLNQAGIVQADIGWRVKHLYSIWRKMQKKQRDISQLYDIRAVRILVADVQTCYRVLSLLHEAWVPIPSEFSDYIASPKPNGYRSIHTVIQGPNDRVIEVQIRTFAMHEASEMGVAAHWRYKEGATKQASLESRINWLRSLLAWQIEMGVGSQALHTLREQVIDSRIYVLTPEGDVVDLPKGATPLDFAYRVHTQVGHRFRGAKVDGVMVPIATALQTGQRVEILTRPESKPSRDWLRKDSGCLVSPRARAKVQQWFREQEREQHVHAGKLTFQHACQKHGIALATIDWVYLLGRYELVSQEAFYAHIDSGKIHLPQVLQILLQPSETPLPTEPLIAVTEKAPPSAIGADQLTIEGVDNLLFHMAGCCRPVFGDLVKGYITQGRGVTVHRTDCPVLLDLCDKQENRIVPVCWGKQSRQSYSVAMQLLTEQKQQTSKDLTQLLAQHKIALLRLQSSAHKSGLDAMNLVIEVKDIAQLAQLQGQIAAIAGVRQVRRGR